MFTGYYLLFVRSLNTKINTYFPTPDYARAVEINTNTYTVEEDGYISAYVTRGNSGGNVQMNLKIAVNGITAFRISLTATVYPLCTSPYIPVAAGDVVTFSLSGEQSVKRFAPIRR